MTTTTLLRTGALLAVTTLAAACGSDTVTSPTFGAACTVGSIAPGQTVTGTLSPSSCVNPYDFWSEDRVPYESHTVSLTQGKAYLFYEAQIPDPAQDSSNDVDAVLTLWGKNSSGASVPLAISDDDGHGIDGHDSQIWFIAPTSGTFELTTASYWDAGYGGYRLEAHECPVLATLDTAGTYNLTLAATPCVRVGAGGDGADTSVYAMLAVPADAGETIDVTVTSAAFTPAWEMFGPGFDTYANIYDVTETGSGTGSGSTDAIVMDTLSGVITLAVGSSTTDSLGAFTVTIGRTPAVAPPIGAAPWSLARVPFMTRKAAPPPKR